MNRTARKISRWSLTAVTLVYLTLFLIIPNVHLFLEAVEPGFKTLAVSLFTKYALAAIKNTFIVVTCSLFFTIPLGLLTSLLIVRDSFPGKKALNGFVDIPFAAPAAIGAFALMITYGPRGLLGPLLQSSGIKIIFAMPGMILATVFVTLPFMIREIVPLLEEIGTEAEDAAHTLGASRWQTLIFITLPSLKEGIIHGISLSYSRALGEFGAILVLSGNILGVTQTIPIYIYDSYIDYHMQDAYAGALLLILLSIAGRALLGIWKRKSKI